MLVVFLLLLALAAAARPLVSRPHAVIRADSLAAAEAIAAEVGATLDRPLAVPGHYLAEMHPDMPAHAAVTYVTERDAVATRVGARPTPAIRMRERDAPLAADWPLVATNARAAWARTAGAGAVIVVPDTGVDWTHPDLAAVDGAHALDVTHRTSSGMPVEPHGTSAASMAVAADNDQCGTGVAPAATLIPVVLLERGVMLTSTLKAEALMYAPTGHVAVVSNSWGPNDYAPMVNRLDTVLRAAFAALHARNTTVVFAAGNGFEYDDHMALDGFASSRHTLAVGAVGADGRAAYYTEAGAVAVAAPSSSDVHGVTAAQPVAGAQPGCTAEFGGTSAAAPQVAGMVALVVSAAPSLTPADVLDVLIRAAAANPRGVARAEPMQRNAAGLYYSPRLGFGVPDAAAAVELALNRTARWVARDVSAPLAVPHPYAVYGTSAYTADVAQNGTVLWASATLGLEFGSCALARVGAVTLRSPAGTVAQVFAATATWAVKSVSELEMPTRAFHGEPAAGTWTVTIEHSCSPSILLTDVSRVELQIV